jgi:hypothetical protein
MKAFLPLALAISCLHSFLVAGVLGRPHIRRSNQEAIAICKKTRSGRYEKRTVPTEPRVRRIIDRGGGFVGDPVRGYTEDGFVFGADCQPVLAQESPIVNPLSLNPAVYDCELCPCGYFDGCNSCGCVSPAGPAACTLKFCEVLERPRCEPCDPNLPPPSSSPTCCNPLKEPGQFDNPFCFEGVVCCPDGSWSCSIGDGVSFPCGGEIITDGFGEVCELDCKLCPDGLFDGCNTCDCSDPDRPICTKIACGPDDVKPKTCTKGPSPPPRDTKCCDPADEPGRFGNLLCDEGHACCPDGTWTCNIGDGISFPCGGELISSGFGEACDKPSCCDPLD